MQQPTNVGFIQILRNGRFFRLWLGQVISAIGDYFYFLAMPILIITSFYGMNVPHFLPPPEDRARISEAYLWIFGTTVVTTFLLYWWLKRKGWF